MKSWILSVFLNIGCNTMSQVDWRTEYPELVTFLKEEVLPVVDAYGRSYYEAVDRSYDDYGYGGLSMQLLYVSDNLKKGNVPISRQLNLWSKRIDKEQNND